MLKTYIAAQNHVKNLKERVSQDVSGASLIEYSILIGLITVAVVGLISAVGGWVNTQWTTLNANL